MKEKRFINVMEVCPRDGWQNLPRVIPTEEKKYFIEKMLDAGIKKMQICSFVSPRAIPQMHDAKEVSAYFIKNYPDCEFNALIPNLRGAKDAVESGFNKVSYVVSVSESHNKANIGMTHEQSKEGLAKIMEGFPSLGITLALATSFGCPFEGNVPFERVMDFIDYGIKKGIKSFELADTIGVANPVQIKEVFSSVKEKHPDIILMAHMHDTRNNGIINSWTASENGADIIHTALGGLGGCPFAPGASGNTSTEDIVYILERSGFETGIDFKGILAAAKEMRERIPGTYSGHHINIVSDSYEEALRAGAK